MGYHINVTIHLLAALLWLGGMFFLALVGAPVLRQVEPRLRAQLFSALGERFRTVGWAAIAVLLVTGVINLHYRGLLQAQIWTTTTFWSTRMGEALAWKLGAVAVMIALSAFHDFVAGPRAARLARDSAATTSARRQAAWLARANAIVGIGLVFAAVRLARGG
jgi:copper resistance protein D